MADLTKRDQAQPAPPGSCVPVEVKLAELGQVTGDERLVREQWDGLDHAAYLYLWFWVHR